MKGPTHAEVLPGDRGEAVAELRRLADKPRLAGRSTHLHKLADDLEAGTHLDVWAEVDVHAAFLRADTVSAPHNERSAARWILDTAPAVLVFAPVMTTWFGLTFAARAYRDTRADPVLRDMSFLERWQSGFDGALPGWLLFDRVALITLLFILLLIAMVLLQAILRRRSDRAEETEGATLLCRLASVFTAVEFEFARERLSAPAKLSDELSRNVQNVRELGEVAVRTQREALEGLEAAQSSVAEVNRASSAMAAATGDTSATLRRIESVLKAVHDTTGQLTQAVQALTQSSAADSAQLRQAVQDSSALLAGQVSASVDGSHRELVAATDASSAAIAQALGSGSADLRGALDDWQATGAGYTHRVELAADLLGQAAQSLKRLPEEMERLRTQVEELTRELPGATDRAELVGAPVTALASSLERVAGAAESLLRLLAPSMDGKASAREGS